MFWGLGIVQYLQNIYLKILIKEVEPYRLWELCETEFSIIVSVSALQPSGNLIIVFVIRFNLHDVQYKNVCVPLKWMLIATDQNL